VSCVAENVFLLVCVACTHLVYEDSAALCAHQTPFRQRSDERTTRTAEATRLAGRRISGVHSRCDIIIIARPNELLSFCLQSPLLWGWRRRAHSSRCCIFLIDGGNFFFFLPPAVVAAMAVALLNFFAAGCVAEGGLGGRSGVRKTSSTSSFSASQSSSSSSMSPSESVCAH